MEEQRIGMMYLNLLKRWFIGRWDGLFPRGLRRSSALPALIVVAIVGIPGLGYYLHMRGRFHTLKSEIKGDQGPQTPRPGGADPLVLIRQQTPEDGTTAFRSATILPGLGMGVLQITASLPNRGEVALLAAPTVDELANGNAPPRNGPNDTHGAIEVPWGGVLTGIPTPAGTTLRTSWRGNTIEVPLDSAGRGTASGGLLGFVSADTAQVSKQSTGPVASGTFRATEFNQHWMSKTDVSVAVSMDARTMYLTVTAKNVGDQPEPLGIGWHPRFLVPSGDRNGVELRLPMGEEMEVADRIKGTPSGHLVAPASAVSRLQGHMGTLGADSFDATIVNPKPGLMDETAAAEMRDPASGFGLRMTVVSSSIRVLRVTSPSGANWVSMGTQTNFDDPLGREWAGTDGQGITTLLPGQTAEWSVRLEIFPVLKHGGAVQ